jgi:tetratricopeptide (TPR) repeat protein
MNLAEYYDEKGKIDSSAYYFYLLSDKIGKGLLVDTELQVNIYVKLTAFWTKMDYDSVFVRKAVGLYIEKAQDAARQLPDSSEQLKKIYFLQGLSGFALKQYETARSFFFEYLASNLDLSPYRIISTYLNISETYILENQPRKALQYIKKVEDITKDSSFRTSLQFFLSVTNFMKGRALYQLGEYQKAIDLISDNLAKLPRSGNALHPESVEAHKIIANCYEALGNYKAALDEKNMYIYLHDSLLQSVRSARRRSCARRC